MQWMEVLSADVTSQGKPPTSTTRLSFSVPKPEPSMTTRVPPPMLPAAGVTVAMAGSSVSECAVPFRDEWNK